MRKSVFITMAMVFLLITIAFAVDFIIDGFTRFEFYLDEDNTCSPRVTLSCGQTFRMGSVGSNDSMKIEGISIEGYHGGAPVNHNLSLYIYGADNRTNITTGSAIAWVKDFRLDNFGNGAGNKGWRNLTMNQTGNLIQGGYYIIWMNVTGGDMEWSVKGAGAYITGTGETIGSQTVEGAITTEKIDDKAFQIWGKLLGITTTLQNPNDKELISQTTINFSANHIAEGVGLNLSNATYFIWNSTGIFNNTETQKINGTSNFTSKVISGFQIQNYTWNVYACGINTTATQCRFGTNRTFGIGIRVNSEIYSSETIEGTSEKFELNISIPPTLQVTTARLRYNDTDYTGTITNLGLGNYTLTKTLSIPSVSAKVNQTFFWNIRLNQGLERNITGKNQTVNNIGIDDCSIHTNVILNYTVRDEENTSALLGGPHNTSVEIDLDIFSPANDTPIINFSHTYSNVNPAQVCLSINLQSTTRYEMDVQTRYSSLSRAEELHHLQNFTLRNSTIPQDIGLYDLNNSDATKFLITFKDSNFLPVEDALIDIQRKYIGEGVFRSVEIPKTDDSGQAVAHFDLEGIVYTILIQKEGVILATFDNIAVVCQDLIIGDCRINLNAPSTSQDFSDWEEIGGLTFSMTFDESTRVINTIFTTVDGSSKTVLINTTKFDRFGNDTVCSDTLTSSSGTLTCTIPPSYGNVTVTSKLFADGELITTRIFRITPKIGEFFGSDAAIMIIIMLLTIPLMLITSTIAVVLGVIVGLIMATLLLILTSGSVIGIGSTIMWAIIAGGIIIWRISQMERG